MKQRTRVLAYTLILIIFMLIAGYVRTLIYGPGEISRDVPESDLFPVPQIELNPRVYRSVPSTSEITIDGRLDEIAWQNALWTEEFVDIRGESQPAPRYSTRAKMLWNDEYFYIAAVMEEPHLWGTLTDRDAVIFHDNDFEVFIDPDWDTHGYYELEVNTLNTQWDLLLGKPYRDGAPAIDSWDIQGLQTAVHLDGTLNDPSDVDAGWSIEIALPWSVLEECAHRPAPPQPGDQWRINFSRVQWHLETAGDSYQKQTDPNTGEELDEDNWVWSPQGLIAMHYPEMWGIVEFCDSGAPDSVFIPEYNLQAFWMLRQWYYAQKRFYQHHQRYATARPFLNRYYEIQPVVGLTPRIRNTYSGYEIALHIPEDVNTVYHIDEMGRFWCSMERR